MMRAAPSQTPRLSGFTLQLARLHQRIEPQPIKMLRQPVKSQSAFEPVHASLLLSSQVCAGSAGRFHVKVRECLTCV